MTSPVLLVKISSLGDVLHLLPAVTDACRLSPGVRFHWVVEEGFAEVPAWHPGVERVIRVALRRWRRFPVQSLRFGEPVRFLRELRSVSYRLVVDCQGLFKSALITRMARGQRFGFDYRSAREPGAAFFYHHPVAVSRNLHAVTRLRQLMAGALSYPVPHTPPDYGLQPGRFRPQDALPYFVFLHGTTWDSKQWPEAYWCELVRIAAKEARVVFPWGNAQEQARAQRFAAVAQSRCRVHPKTDLAGLARLLAGSQGVVAVDSGPAHLAAALGITTVCLYGPTDPDQVGTLGQGQHHLRGQCPLAPCRKRQCPLPGAPARGPACFQRLTPATVWAALSRQRAG